MEGQFRNRFNRVNAPTWIDCKHGFPVIKWSSRMLDCETTSAEEYFSLPENKLTENAYRFRLDKKLEEIEELKDLTPEERRIIFEEMDELEDETGTYLELSRKRDKLRYRTSTYSVLYKYYVSLGYIPTNLLYERNRGYYFHDNVDRYLQTTFNLAKTLPEKLDEVLYAQDLAVANDIKDKHIELWELEEKLRREIKENGLEPLPHMKRYIMVDGRFGRSIQKVNDEGELVWTTIEKAAREIDQRKLEQYKEYFVKLGLPEDQIERYIYRKQLQKWERSEEYEEEMLRQKLAMQGSLDAYNPSTVVDIRDKADYLKKALIGLGYPEEEQIYQERQLHKEEEEAEEEEYDMLVGYDKYEDDETDDQEYVAKRDGPKKYKKRKKKKPPKRRRIIKNT